ncbi:CRTAC1 family protein [Armatimonas sp.]|uniref:CRTAC1 family protein n=1 Tax=Armatimonas sp. TaxID=1872638 RepID=UPI00286CBCAF|nr:CRTAC1 family protein [Armatimonas sp.]
MSSPQASALFADVTQSAGISFHHENGAKEKKFYFPETTPAGCALVDLNNDGWLDIVLIQSGSLDKPDAPENGRCALYLNEKNGKFQDVTAGSGLDVSLGYAHGITVGDIDNDGYSDLFITSFAGNRLFHNENGSGKFTDISAVWGVNQRHSTGYATSAAFGDYDNDGKLDLYVCYYCPWEKSKDKICNGADKVRDYCSPEVYPIDEHQLFHNEGGRFTDVSKAMGISSKKGRGLAVSFLDYDSDGWCDIFVANDLSGNFLWKNLKGKGFKDIATEAGCAFSTSGSLMAGMGIAISDYDHSGQESLFVTNFQNTPNALFKNSGAGFFDDVSTATQVGPLHLPYLSFGCAFIDYDADGWPDLLTANGHVQLGGKTLEAMKQPKQLLHSEGGKRFREVKENLGPLAISTVARGLVTGDFDNDGRLDVLFTNQNDAPQLLRNQDKSSNHWISFQTIGTKSNRNGYQARLRLTGAQGTRLESVRSATSFLSASDPRVYFGLGAERKVEKLEVLWPSGIRETLGPLEGDRRYVLTEGKGVTETLLPGK